VTVKQFVNEMSSHVEGLACSRSKRVNMSLLKLTFTRVEVHHLVIAGYTKHELLRTGRKEGQE